MVREKSAAKRSDFGRQIPVLMSDTPSASERRAGVKAGQNAGYSYISLKVSGLCWYSGEKAGVPLLFIAGFLISDLRPLPN
jgi:hypothetical protein